MTGSSYGTSAWQESPLDGKWVGSLQKPSPFIKSSLTKKINIREELGSVENKQWRNLTPKQLKLNQNATADTLNVKLSWSVKQTNYT